MPTDRGEAPVHEPGDEDGATDQAEEVAEGPEEDELEGAHRVRRVGRAGGTDPAPDARGGGEDVCARSRSTGRSGGRQARDHTGAWDVERRCDASSSVLRQTRRHRTVILGFIPGMRARTTRLPDRGPKLTLTRVRPRLLVMVRYALRRSRLERFNENLQRTAWLATGRPLRRLLTLALMIALCPHTTRAGPKSEMVTCRCSTYPTASPGVAGMSRQVRIIATTSAWVRIPGIANPLSVLSGLDMAAISRVRTRRDGSSRRWRRCAVRTRRR